MKKTKILCTIGPATISKSVLKAMYERGMNGVRINTVFGDFKQYTTIIQNIRSICQIPVVIDIIGPGIRTIVEEVIPVNKGETITLGFDGHPFTLNHDLYDHIEVRDRICINGGKIETEVTSKGGRVLRLRVKNNGKIEDKQSVSIPSKIINVPQFSERDLQIIKFAKEQETEYIALSFTRTKRDIQNLRQKAGDVETGVIAKIENFQGVDNANAIIEEADAIMIARGDLGVDIGFERVPIIQKQLIQRCNQKGKTVITATEMLESMIETPTPTRAETSDVANAILDGSDALMLSGETSIGKYPVKTVAMMTKIAEQVETVTTNKVKAEAYQNISSAISWSIHEITEAMPINKIVTMTRTGYTARMISRFKLNQPIIAVTPSRIVRDQLNLTYGVEPLNFDYTTGKDMVLAVAQFLYSIKLVDEEDIILFTAGIRTTTPHTSNLIEIHKIKELLEAR